MLEYDVADDDHRDHDDDDENFSTKEEAAEAENSKCLHSPDFSNFSSSPSPATSSSS